MYCIYVNTHDLMPEKRKKVHYKPIKKICQLFYFS